MNKNVICLGASGSSKTIIDILMNERKHRIIGILDDDENIYNKDFLGVTIIGKISDILKHLPDKSNEAIICVGATKDTINRKKIYRKAKFKINCENLSKNEIVNNIIDLYERK